MGFPPLEPFYYFVRDCGVSLLLHLSMRTLSLLALLLALSTPAVAQQRGTLRGTVTDSIAGGPLRDATVQLVSRGAEAPTSRTATSDSLGRFTFEDVPAGEYLVGFLHPALDALGLEPIARAVRVTGSGELRADLATPSPARLRGAHCGADAGGGMVMGSVRAARGGMPVSGATVSGEWREYAIGGGGVAQRIARREARTGSDGGFVLCDVPSPGTVLLLVAQGADSTDRVEAEVPERGFLRRDLYLGEAVVSATRDTADSLAFRPRTGPGRLTGTVLSATNGEPLANARVRVVDGQPTRADARGEWTLTGAPSGTRVVEVRAPGYYPVQRVVDITDGAPPLRVTLSRFAAMLDTIRVTARSQSLRARTGGFQERRESLGMGRFLTAEDIERRHVIDTADLFATIPGLIRERASDGDEAFYMRGLFSSRCVPAIYVNGQMMRNILASDVDMLVRPRDIAAMEVYTESQVPPQFQDAMSGCGSIVFWTK